MALERAVATQGTNFKVSVQDLTSLAKRFHEHWALLFHLQTFMARSGTNFANKADANQAFFKT